MKESKQRGSFYTLEELVRTHSKKPPKEMLNGIAKARDVIREFNLPGLLGISGIDQVLFHAYFAERIVRTRIYDFDWVTHSPEFDFTKEDIKRDEKNRQKLQDSLDGLVLGSSEIVANSYVGAKQRIRARNLELAANDLVARATSFNEKNFVTEIVVSDELIENWAPRWHKELN